MHEKQASARNLGTASDWHEQTLDILSARHDGLGDGPEWMCLGRAIQRVTRRNRAMRARERFRRAHVGERDRLRALVGVGGARVTDRSLWPRVAHAFRTRKLRAAKL